MYVYLTDLIITKTSLQMVFLCSFSMWIQNSVEVRMLKKIKIILKKLDKYINYA